MTITITSEMHNWVVDHVLGTCDFRASHEQDFNKEFNLPEGDETTFGLALKDADIFLCTECGWYCEVYEMSEHCDEYEEVCSDCK